MSAWAWIGLAAYAATVVISWRSLMRGELAIETDDEWADFLLFGAFATFYAALFGPFMVAYRLLVSGADALSLAPADVARALAGEDFMRLLTLMRT